MVKIEGVSLVNVSNINQQSQSGSKDPTISQNMEKAPKLGFGNAFLIGLKALGKSVTSEKTFAAIRSELKKEVLDTKVEQRIEKLVSKFQGTNIQKVALASELREQVLIRKMGLDTSPSSLQQSVDAHTDRRLGLKNDSPKSKLGIVVPSTEIAKNPSALKAHFSNFIDRVQKEFEAANLPKDRQLQSFEKLLTDFVANSLTLAEIQTFDQTKLGGVVRQFHDEQRTEKKQFMEVIRNVFASLDNPQSDLSKKIGAIGIQNLKRELARLPEQGATEFLRGQTTNQLNMMLYINGGEKLTKATGDFVKQMPVNEKF